MPFLIGTRVYMQGVRPAFLKTLGDFPGLLYIATPFLIMFGAVPINHGKVLPGAGLDGLNDLDGKPEPALQVTAVFIRSLVPESRLKLIKQASFVTVQLYCIYSPRLYHLGSKSKSAHQLLNFLDCQLSRRDRWIPKPGQRRWCKGMGINRWAPAFLFC